MTEDTTVEHETVTIAADRSLYMSFRWEALDGADVSSAILLPPGETVSVPVEMVAVLRAEGAIV